MKNQKNQHIRFEQGITLIEIGIALILMTLILVGITAYLQSSNRQLQLRADAKQFAVLAEAATAYLQDEQAKLIAKSSENVTGPGNNYGMTDKLLINNEKLKPYLPPGISETFGRNQQRVTLLLKIQQDATFPSGWNTQGVLFTHGGKAYDNDEIGQIANFSSVSIGRISDQAPGNITGPNAAWTIERNNWPDLNNMQQGYLATRILVSAPTANKIALKQQQWSADHQHNIQTPNYLYENKPIENTQTFPVMLIFNVHHRKTQCGNIAECWHTLWGGNIFSCILISVEGVNISQQCTRDVAGRLYTSNPVLVPPGHRYTVSSGATNFDKVPFLDSIGEFK